jgi:hypothetical protein
VNANRVATLKKTVAEFEACVASFEKARLVMLQRRQSAVDGAMVVLEDMLKHNERTLKSLRQGVDFLKVEIAREEKKSAHPWSGP